jgi:hypothetical protein
VAFFVLLFVEIVFGQVIKTPKADIEFIGLEKWTAQDLYNNIVAANPGKPFHACAVYLTDTLKFADASVTMDLFQGRLYTIVTVVEPQFASRIHYRESPKVAQPANARFSSLAEIYRSHPNEYMIALQLAGYHFGKPDYDVSKTGLGLDEETIAIVRRVWQALDILKTPKDKALALEVINNDADYLNRVPAISVLGNFLDSDSTWQSLIDLFRENDSRISSSATALLTAHAQVQKRLVDWASATATLRALLDGTNLFAFVPTVKILTVTKVSPKLASPLLKDGGALLIDFLKANRQNEKNLAHGLLVQLAGQDLGYDSVKWSAWIKSL